MQPNSNPANRVPPQVGTEPVKAAPGLELRNEVAFPSEIHSTLKSQSQPEVLLYHSTLLRFLPSILSEGLFLSTKEWTVATVPIVRDNSDDVVFAFKVPANALTEPEKGSLRGPLLISEAFGTQVRLSDNLRTHLKRFDRFYLPQDKYFDTTAKPSWLRQLVSRAHNILEADNNRTIVRVDFRDLDFAAMLEVNKTRRCFSAVKSAIDKIQNGADVASGHESPFKYSKIAGWLLDLAGDIYQRIPKWESRAFKEYTRREAWCAAYWKEHGTKS